VSPRAAGVMPKKNSCPEAKPAEVFRRSAPLETVRRKHIRGVPSDLVTVELRVFVSAATGRLKQALGADC
jgi:hypothetical protein